ncbi:MAG: hypothetical protein M3154_01190 [Candidatus Eremiobacteraeota bacterium]|nr:hypothetical protein [Candidatus Eremiobacteraeota bacterium]
MNALATAIREVWGLFVEDASLTIGILACLALAVFVLPRVIHGADWRGPVLFVTLAVVLLENVYRSARE